MKIEIDDSYIQWIEDHNPGYRNLEAWAEYINEVLHHHRLSWDLAELPGREPAQKDALPGQPD